MARPEPRGAALARRASRARRRWPAAALSAAVCGLALYASGATRGCVRGARAVLPAAFAIGGRDTGDARHRPWGRHLSSARWAEAEGAAETAVEAEAEAALDAHEGEEKVEGGDEEASEAEAEKPKKWTCISCSASNFATAEECHKCGAAKPSEEEMALLVEKANAEEDVKKAMDEFLRLQADLANYRRSHDSEMTRAKDLGMQDALRKLVPFTLEVEKALVAPEGMTEKESKFFQSYSILFRKVQAVWGKFGVSAQEVKVGDKFDPARHRKAEARPAQGDQVPGTILEVLEPGWLCEGKVLLPSEVAIVAFPEPKEEKKPPPPPPAGEDKAAGEKEAAGADADEEMVD